MRLMDEDVHADDVAFIIEHSLRRVASTRGAAQHQGLEVLVQVQVLAETSQSKVFCLIRGSATSALGAMFKMHAQVQAANSQVSAMPDVLTDLPLLPAGLVQALVGKA